MYNLETRLQTQNQREYRERILSAYQVRIFLSTIIKMYTRIR